MALSLEALRMQSNGMVAGWVPVARETFEYNLVPWFGRRYAPWLRACAREHPVDPRGQVLIPDQIYRVFTNGHRIGERVSERQLQQMGYPHLPAEDELAEARQALRAALAQGAFEAVPPLASRVQVLQEQIAETKEALRHGRVPTPGWKPAPAEVVVPLPARPEAVPTRQPVGQPALAAAA